MGGGGGRRRGHVLHVGPHVSSFRHIFLLKKLGAPAPVSVRNITFETERCITGMYSDVIENIFLISFVMFRPANNLNNTVPVAKNHLKFLLLFITMRP